MIDLWHTSAKAHLDAWITLSHRVPMLLTGAASEREKARMVSEKVAAGVDAAWAAARATRAVLLRKPASNPTALLGQAAEITLAAARPFHTRVARNAGRLSRVAKTPPRSG